MTKNVRWGTFKVVKHFLGTPFSSQLATVALDPFKLLHDESIFFHVEFLGPSRGTICVPLTLTLGAILDGSKAAFQVWLAF